MQVSDELKRTYERMIMDLVDNKRHMSRDDIQMAVMVIVDKILKGEDWRRSPLQQQPQPTDYPTLDEMSDADLVALLADYARKPKYLEIQDREFIAAIQARLKQRRPKKE